MQSHAQAKAQAQSLPDPRPTLLQVPVKKQELIQQSSSTYTTEDKDMSSAFDSDSTWQSDFDYNETEQTGSDTEWQQNKNKNTMAATEQNSNQILYQKSLTIASLELDQGQDYQVWGGASAEFAARQSQCLDNGSRNKIRLEEDAPVSPSQKKCCGCRCWVIVLFICITVVVVLTAVGGVVTVSSGCCQWLCFANSWVDQSEKVMQKSSSSSTIQGSRDWDDNVFLSANTTSSDNAAVDPNNSYSKGGNQNLQQLCFASKDKSHLITSEVATFDDQSDNLMDSAQKVYNSSIDQSQKNLDKRKQPYPPKKVTIEPSVSGQWQTLLQQQQNTLQQQRKNKQQFLTRSKIQINSKNTKAGLRIRNSNWNCKFKKVVTNVKKRRATSTQNVNLLKRKQKQLTTDTSRQFESQLPQQPKQTQQEQRNHKENQTITRTRWQRQNTHIDHGHIIDPFKKKEQEQNKYLHMRQRQPQIQYRGCLDSFGKNQNQTQHPNSHDLQKAVSPFTLDFYDAKGKEDQDANDIEPGDFTLEDCEVQMDETNIEDQTAFNNAIKNITCGFASTPQKDSHKNHHAPLKKRHEQKQQLQLEHGEDANTGEDELNLQLQLETKQHYKCSDSGTTTPKKHRDEFVYDSPKKGTTWQNKKRIHNISVFSAQRSKYQ